MLEVILIIFVVFSFAGITAIVFRKIPALINLPAVSSPKDPLLLRLKNKIKNLPGAETIDYEFYLQKVLSKIRVLTLKTEQKTGHWLEKLRQKSRQKQIDRQDDYWEKLKKTRGKSKLPR
ncbi:MAG: hypothetical protein HYT21_01525 [Candidatus Nealsonbacteria bacterium]|nr:hypothetical protein [Candidatus Nealsonbacteria bacterium]